jgi:hypothetical protein
MHKRSLQNATERSWERALDELFREVPAGIPVVPSGQSELSGSSASLHDFAIDVA